MGAVPIQFLDHHRKDFPPAAADQRAELRIVLLKLRVRQHLL